MDTCLVCQQEIQAASSEICVTHYGLTMHAQCEEKYIDFVNTHYKNDIFCKCGQQVLIFCKFEQGKQVGIGRCICGRVYVTSRYPSNPNAHKIKAPKRGV